MSTIIEVNLNINTNFGPIGYKRPVLVLRKVLSDPEIVQLVFDKAVYYKPLTIQPVIRNPQLARLKLLQLGLLRK